jgi:hypothetical protein
MGMDIVEYLSKKEQLTRIKLKLIKTAAMLKEDEIYTKENAFQDIMKILWEFEEFDESFDYFRLSKMETSE